VVNRYANVDNAKRFAHHVVPEVVRPARIIWNQAIGAIFVLFSVYFLGYAALHTDNVAAVGGGLFLGLVMAYFGVTSFRRARRVSRLSRP